MHKVQKVQHKLAQRYQVCQVCRVRASEVLQINKPTPGQPWQMERAERTLKQNINCTLTQQTHTSLRQSQQTVLMDWPGNENIVGLSLLMRGPFNRRH